MGALVPLVAIVTSIGVPALVIVLIVAYSHKKKIARYDLIEKALNSNTSPEVVEQLVKSISEEEQKRTAPPKERHLTHAVVLIALGISFFALRFIIGGNDFTGLVASGAVLTMLGLAKLVIAFFIVGKTNPNR